MNDDVKNTIGKKSLYAGAGNAPIRFTEDMFPINSEHFSHVHDESLMQVLSVVADTRYVIVTMGLAAPGNLTKVREIISSVFDVSKENIIIHSKHVLSMPHVGGPNGIPSSVESMISNERRHGVELTPEIAEVYCRNEAKMLDAIYTAIREAAKQALDSEQPAEYGFGECYCEVNVNRVIPSSNTWIQGTNPDGPTDRTVSILRFDAKDHSPIAILFTCNTAPGVLEHSVLSDGRQGVSGDIAAEAENFINAQFPGVVSMYTSSATGDQWQALRAVNDYMDHGSLITKDMHETGYAFVEILGTRLGAQVTSAAEKIVTYDLGHTISLHHFVREYPGQEMQPMPKPGESISSNSIPQKAEAGYDILLIDDNAIVFCGVELCVNTVRMIKEKSPFRNTLLIGFACDKGDGYMAEKSFYDHQSYQSLKSHYAAGTAEQFREDIIRDLNHLYV